MEKKVKEKTVKAPKNQPKKVVSEELSTDKKNPGHTTRAFRE